MCTTSSRQNRTVLRLSSNWKKVVGFLVTFKLFSTLLSVGLDGKTRGFFLNMVFHIYIVSPSHCIVDWLSIEIMINY